MLFVSASSARDTALINEKAKQKHHRELNTEKLCIRTIFIAIYLHTKQ